MADQPFLPFFVGDFLGATVTWEGEERALYMLMLAYQWSGGPLPSNLEKLSRTLGYPHDKFTALWDTVRTKFVARKGSLYNERLESHRARTIELSSARSHAGTVGGRASAAKRAAQARAKGQASHQANDQAIVESSLPKSQANAEAKPKQNSTILSYPILSDPIQRSHTHTGGEEARAEGSKGKLDAANGDVGQGYQPPVDSAPYEQAIMAKYPKGPNPPNWQGALLHARALVDAGLSTWPELVAVTERYANYIASGASTVNVAAHNFFDRRKGNHWQQSWDVTPTNGGITTALRTGRKTIEDYDREMAARIAAAPGEDPGPL